MVGLLIAVIYLCFISLGLPDSLLGSAWPTMYKELNVPLSYAGLLSGLIALNTIISALLSDRLTHKFGPGKVTLFSVFLTAFALLGFSLSNKLWMLILFAIPYGLGAGGVDAALNNYVALHYSSKHMSWLHCMWGLGALISPYIMSYALTYKSSWNKGYLYVSIIQFVITIFIFLSLPLWKKKAKEDGINATGNEKAEPVKLKEVIKMKGAVELALCFFAYCALEQTSMLWSTSYIVSKFNLDASYAAKFGSLVYIGITIGRFINGFLTMKLSDKTLIRAGQVIIFIALDILIFSNNQYLTFMGLALLGIGCAPIYPCIIKSTPRLFDPKRSQALVGMEMASAYIGTLSIPPLFGILANNISVNLLPFVLMIILILMFVLHETVEKKCSKREEIKESI